MEGLNALTALLSTIFVISDNHNRLTLLLLNLSRAHLNLHVIFRKALHGWSKRPTTSTSSILTIVSSDGVVVWVSAISVLVLESTLQFGEKTGMASDVSNQVELHDRISWNIGSLIFETTVHVNGLVVMSPDGMSESLNRVEFLPFRVFSLINFHEDVLANGISPSTENNHESSDEDG